MYQLTKNIVLFQKNLILINDSGSDNRITAANVQAELMRFGFMLNQDAFTQLGKADKADIIDFYNETVDYLKYITGGNRDYKPFYPGFPQQVMNMTESQLWMNQFIYYWSGCKFQPEPWMEPFKTAFETVKYKMISLANEDQFNKIFTDLCSVGNSLTPQDTETIKWFVDSKQILVFPQSIPFKENLCLLAAMGLDVPVKTTTDVLRIAVHMSGGDISLPAVPNKTISVSVRNGWRSSYQKQANPEREKFKFKKFKRSERRYLLALLEKTNCNAKEMVLKDQRWIRLGEILHPGEYQSQFPKSYRAFQLIRNNKVVSWYGDVSQAFSVSFESGLAKLSERPGEFIRRLDYLIRNNLHHTGKILETLFKVGKGCSNKVLFETFTHFEDRDKPVTGRSIFIKGARKKTVLPNLPALPKHTVEAVQDTIFQSLKSKFSELEPMGDCWVDEELKKIPLPTNMRSLSESLVPIIRGQRVPMAVEKKVIRPFIHWFDERGNEDIDLHGFLVGKTTMSFGYNGVHNHDIGCYSGDVRNRRGPCAEYVDINVLNAINFGFKYFITIAHNFTGRPFSSMKDVVVGVQEREFPLANDLWLPDTIVNCIRPQGKTSWTLLGAYDLETREYIHLDLDYDDSSRNNLLKIIESYLEPPKYSVYDLLSWHVESRGRLVSKESAEKHFLYDDFSTSYVETMKFMGV